MWLHSTPEEHDLNKHEFILNEGASTKNPAFLAKFFSEKKILESSLLSIGQFYCPLLI